MRSILKVLFFFLITTTAFPQKTICNKFIPYFGTLNAEKLSHRLTDNLKNDSAKIYSIHCWVTHHIKYDIKKSQSFDFKRTSIKKILRKRKAICIGYSDLFNELCKYANIISTDIPGYIKNEHVDLNDKFYLDEHIWNAVYINNEWKLIDACWDAGYIKPYKRTFFGNIMYILSIGTIEIVKFKPNFKFYPTNRYYLKNGTEFIIDHTPSNPIWQLTNSIKTIVQFEKDSSFYLNSREVINNNASDSKFDGEKLRIAKMTQKEKDIYYGPVSYSYNYKNHYPIGISESIKAFDIYNTIDNKSKDTIIVLKKCDSVLVKLDTAKLHFDSTIFYLNKQKEELKTNNRKKNETLKLQNKRLISSTKTAEKNIRSGKKLSLNAKKAFKKINKTNNFQLNKLNESEKFEKAKTLKLYRSIDSLNSVRKTEALKDSLILINISISKHFALLDSMNKLCSNKFANYSHGCMLNTSATTVINKNRMHYYDDWDYEIIKIKDSIIKYKFSFDSLLLDTDNQFIIKSFLKETIKLKTLYKNLYNYHKSLANEYVKLKKYNVNEDVISLLYENNLAQYSYELSQYSIALTRIKISFQEFKKRCKKQIKPSKTERKSYIREKYIEIKMFSLRTKYINKHYNALSNLSKKKTNECEKIKSKTEKIKTKYYK